MNMAQAALKTQDLIADIQTALEDKALLVDVEALSEPQRASAAAMQRYETSAKKLSDVYARVRSKLPDVLAGLMHPSDDSSRSAELNDAIASVAHILSMLADEEARQKQRTSRFSSFLREANQLKSSRFAAQASLGIKLTRGMHAETRALKEAFREFEDQLRRLNKEANIAAKAASPLIARPVANPDYMATARKVMAQTKRARAHLSK